MTTPSNRSLREIWKW